MRVTVFSPRPDVTAVSSEISLSHKTRCKASVSNVIAPMQFSLTRIDMGRYVPPDQEGITSANKLAGKYVSLFAPLPDSHLLRKQTRTRFPRPQSRPRHPHRPLRNALRNLVLPLSQTHHHRPRGPLQCREKESWELSLHSNIRFPDETQCLWGMD